MTILDDVPRKHLKVLEAVCGDIPEKRRQDRVDAITVDSTDTCSDDLDDLIDAVTIDDLEQWAKQPMP